MFLSFFKNYSMLINSTICSAYLFGFKVTLFLARDKIIFLEFLRLRLQGQPSKSHFFVVVVFPVSAKLLKHMLLALVATIEAGRLDSGLA